MRNVTRDLPVAVCITIIVLLIQGLAGCLNLGHAAPPAKSGKWEKVFAEECNGKLLDLTKWTPDMMWASPNNGGNAELQMYDPTAVRLASGKCELHAYKVPRPLPWWGGGEHEYVSGIIQTSKKFDTQYGYFEMRAKLPKGQGIWPAFWLLPYKDDGSTGKWPPELDVMEQLGHEPNRIFANRHYLVGTEDYRQNPGSYTGPDFSAGYHTFGMLWEPGRLSYYVDGIQYHELNNQIPAEPMYLIANVAVGGYWPGNPDASTPWPQAMFIDWIRVWKKK